MASKKPAKPGIMARTGRGVKWLGRAYFWTVAGNLKEVRENTKRIKDGVKGLLNRKYRHETFDEAVARLRLPQRALDDRANRLAAMAFLYGLIASIALLFLVLTPWVGPSLWAKINHAAMSFGVCFVAAAKFITTRFRVAQIRRRKFFEFKDWLFGREGK
jgi:hypothetical protein